MMKISKPVLMNDFMVSHVQFTSLNLVSFKNIKPVYDGNEKILLEYEHPSKIEVSSRDWIGIFPRGWSSLQQYVTFEWIFQSMPSTVSVDKESGSGDVVRRTIAFCPKYHMNYVNQSAFYQFVYVGKQIEVLGVSSYFRFDLSCINDTSLELECLVPVSGKVRSTSVSDFGTISMTNEQSSTSIESRKLVQTSSIHSLQNLDVDGKLNWSRLNFTDDKKNMCLMKRSTNTPTAGTGDNLDPYTSYSEPVFPMSLPLSQCKKCYQFKRGGDILKSQQALQSKLKIVMERNKVLEDRAQEMKKELERLQSESKRMKMSYYNVNKEKVAYEKFVKDFIKSLEKDSIVRVMYGNTEILVKKVNYVGMEEHPRDKKTSKRERELKAVIGLQEITIRNLINSLQEKAKSVEELNQTVKLAQVFSAARTENRDLGLDAEESADELSNSDVASEYEFSIAKPSPPEEVSGDTDDVLDSIRRTSEMKLKNIGITRSLGNESELDVTNLSVLAYDGETVESKPRLVDNVEDCWPFPRTPTAKTPRRKPPEDNVETGSFVQNDEPEGQKSGSVTARSQEEKDCEADPDVAACEDYYDAYDAFSVRSFSPEAEPVVPIPEEPVEEQADAIKEKKEDSGDPTADKNDFLVTAIVPQGSPEEEEETEQAEMPNSSEVQVTTPVPPTENKINKFTCELSIDFGQRRSPQQPMQEETKSEQNTIAIRQSPDDSKVYSLEREQSLITFKKSNQCLEIKITQVDQKQNSTRRFHQKMVLQFGRNQTEKSVGEAESEAQTTTCEEIMSQPEAIECSDVKEEESTVLEEPPVEEKVDLDSITPRTEWNDASEMLDKAEETPKPEEGEAATEEDEGAEEDEGEVEGVPTASAAGEDEVDGGKASESSSDERTTEEERNNIQNVTEESLTNLKMHQDSLRYEKNLQFLTNKAKDGGDDEGLKEKPSALVIKDGPNKLAVIRY